MNRSVAGPVPARWTDVWRAELRFENRAPLPFWPLVAFVNAVFFGLAYSELSDGTIHANWIIFLWVIGAIGAVEVPSRREARLALPVSRPVHALVRGFARSAATLGVFGLMLPLPMLLAWLAAGGPGDAAVLVESFWRLAAAATVAGLLVHAAMLHAESPLWLAVPFFGFVLAMALGSGGPLVRAGEAMVTAYASLGVVLLGRGFGVAPFAGAWAPNAAVWLGVATAALLLSTGLLSERLPWRR
jgi:hypothetical protein